MKLYDLELPDDASLADVINNMREITRAMKRTAENVAKPTLIETQIQSARAHNFAHPYELREVQINPSILVLIVHLFRWRTVEEFYPPNAMAFSLPSPLQNR
jgi:hypothetical protein